MSDLYLVLRNRLDGVPEWVFIEPQILRGARERRGFSYETMAREIHVSSKTWERYEKVGRVPRPLLGVVASVLDLEIEEPARARVVAGSPEERSEVLDRLGEIAGLLERLDRKLDDRDPSERLAAIEAELAELRRAVVRV